MRIIDLLSHVPLFNRERDQLTSFDPLATIDYCTNKTDNRKIVIIGGGIAGLTMAWLLERRGFNDIVIIEASERLGGKIYSYTHDEITHEMGACYTQPAYHGIHYLMRHFGITDKIGVAGRMVYRDNGTCRPFGDDVIEQLRQALGGAWRLMPKELIGIRVLSALARYKKLHRKLLGDYRGQLPPRPSSKVLSALSIPLGAWLSHHKLDLLIPIFRLFQSAQGYGYLETIPAFYGLMWNKPEVIDIAQEQMRGVGQGATLIRGGMGRLIESLGSSLSSSVDMGMKVTEIRRGSKCHVLAFDAQGRHHRYEADQVIVAAPHKSALSWLNPPSSLEKELFSSLVSSRMTTTLQSARQPHIRKIDSWFDNLVPGRDHQVITQRYTGGFLSDHSDSETLKSPVIERVVYQYGETLVPEEEVVACYQAYQESIGCEEHEVVTRCHWPDYFPHWEGAGVAAGNPWRLFESQGKDKTWWVGSSACFESINDVLVYNLLLCHAYIDHHPSPLNR